MEDEEFKQKLALALAGNEEFIKQAKGNYDCKQIWLCVSEQINATIIAINTKIN